MSAAGLAFIRRLDRLMRAAGYETDAELRRVAGVSPSTLSQLRRRAAELTGDAIPGSSETHARLAQALGVSVEVLRGSVQHAANTPRTRAIQAARLIPQLSPEAIAQVERMPDDDRSELAWFRLIEALSAR